MGFQLQGGAAAVDGARIYELGLAAVEVDAYNSIGDELDAELETAKLGETLASGDTLTSNDEKPHSAPSTRRGHGWRGRTIRGPGARRGRYWR